MSAARVIERLVGLTASIALVVAAIQLYERTRAPERGDLDSDAFDLLVTGAQHLWTDSTAALARTPNRPVRIVVFTDLECPFCADLHRSLKELHADQSTRPFSVFLRHAPATRFHPQAWKGATGAICASRVGLLGSFIDNAFMGPQGLAADDMSELLASIDDDRINSFRACVRDGLGSSRVEEDTAMARRLGIDATPTFFIEGNRFRGAISKDSLASVLRRVEIDSD